MASSRSFDHSSQPTLAELVANYLQQRAADQTTGFQTAERESEVFPFEAVPMQPVDPRLAWTEAVAAVRYFQPETDPRLWPIPTEWSILVAKQQPAFALPFCLGNFPQLVRDLNSLIQTTDLAKAQRQVAAAPSPNLEAAAEDLDGSDAPKALLAVGLLRLGGQLERAANLLRRGQATVSLKWQAAWANEEAGLAWQLGRAQAAATMWQAQADNIPVVFNRGMAALFTGRPKEARSWLSRAADHIPEDSSWHHLARLYLALAEMR
jgi:hypothetical protein